MRYRKILDAVTCQTVHIFVSQVLFIQSSFPKIIDLSNIFEFINGGKL